MQNNSGPIGSPQLLDPLRRGDLITSRQQYWWSRIRRVNVWQQIRDELFGEKMNEMTRWRQDCPPDRAAVPVWKMVNALDVNVSRKAYSASIAGRLFQIRAVVKISEKWQFVKRYHESRSLGQAKINIKIPFAIHLRFLYPLTLLVTSLSTPTEILPHLLLVVISAMKSGRRKVISIFIIIIIIIIHACTKHWFCRILLIMFAIILSFNEVSFGLCKNQE